jgi:hypothetical protein
MPKLSRTLTNAEVLEQVARFLRTGDLRHLPAELRGEAEGIRSFVMREAMAAILSGPPPWPASAARPHPGPSASFGEEVRALLCDRADEDSGLTVGDEP